MKDRGFSLLETMVGFAILAMALLALVAILTFSIRSQNKGNQRHTASMIASTLLNQAAHDLGVDFDQSVARPLFHDEYQPEFSAAVAETLEHADLKRVDVTVYWVDQNGDQQEALTCKFLREK